MALRQDTASRGKSRGGTAGVGLSVRGKKIKTQSSGAPSAFARKGTFAQVLNPRLGRSAFALCLFLLGLLVIALPVSAVSDGFISLEKEITGPVGCREWEITLTVEGGIVPRRPMDVVFVIDVSGSMAGSENAVENAVEGFIDHMDLTGNYPDSDRVGIVTYSDSASVLYGLSDEDPGNINLSPNGYTCTQCGLIAGNNQLPSSDPNRVTALILLTDGVPNRRANGSSCGSGSSVTCPTSWTACMQAAVDEGGDADMVFAIGYNYENVCSQARPYAQQVIQQIGTDGYYLGTTSDISSIFNIIYASVATPNAGSDLTLEDVVSSEFDIVPESASPAATSVNYSTNTISWDFDPLASGQEKTFTFHINGPSAPAGTYAANDSTTLSYTDHLGADQELAVSPQPTVAVPPLPVAVADIASGAERQKCYTGGPVSFDLDGTASTGDNLSYFWSADPEVTITGANTATPTVSFSGPGSQVINLVVTDRYGCSSGTSSITLEIMNCNADLAVTKVDSADPVPVGEQLTYTIVVTNNGPSDATGVAVTEALPAGLTYVSDAPSQGTYNSGTGIWNVGSLSNGASASLSLTVLVGAAAVPSVTNTACVTASDKDDPNSANNCGDETTTVFQPTARLTMSPDDTNAAGDTHTFTALLEIDSDGDGSYDPAPAGYDIDFSLVGVGVLSGETTTNSSGIATIVLSSSVIGSSTVTAAWSGTVANVTVTASSDSGEKTWFQPAARLTMSPDDTNAAGDTHTFTALLEIDSDGNGSYETTPAGEDIDFSLVGIGSLSNETPTNASGIASVDVDAPGAGTSTVTAAWNGIVANVSVTATPDSGVKTWIEVRLSLDPAQDTNEIGDNHDFTVTLEYTANGTTWQPLSDKTIEFEITSGPGSLSSPSATTSAAGQAFVTLTSSVTGTTFVNATFDGIAVGASATASDSAEKLWVRTEITIDKSVVDVAGRGPGGAILNANDLITYEIAVSNPGTVDLTGVVTNDPLLVTLSGPTGDDGDSVLEPGETWYYTGSYTVTQADIDANGIDKDGVPDGDGDIDNTATVHCNELPDESSSAAVQISLGPNYSITKSATDTGGDGEHGVADEAGDVIDYRIDVENTGNVSLTNVGVTDPLLASLAGPFGDDGDGVLEVGEAWYYTGSYTVTQADLDANGIDKDGAPDGDGDIDNTATVSCSELADESATEEVPVEFAPAIDLVKTGTLHDDDGIPGVSVGDTISYAFRVENTGNVTLANVTLSDTVGGVAVSGGPIASLAPGAVDTSTFTGSYTVTQADIDAGSFVNTATVTGAPPSGPDVSDPDDETVTLEQAPAIDLVKTGTFNDDGDGIAEVGETISYAFRVENTGNVTLANVTLSDTVGGVAVSGGPIASLAPGAVDTSTFTGSYTVTQADIDAGSFVNTATVTGTPPSGPDVSDPDDETVALEQAPALSIEKTGDVGPIPLGDSIDYTITVTNTGNVTLHNVTVTDPLLGISQNVGTLAPQAFQVINGTYGPVTLNDLPGPVVNTATAVSDEAGPVDDDHSVEVYGNPELTIEKTGDAGPVRIGESINYTITVTNTGDVPLNNVTVTDPLLGISQNLGTLNPSDVRVINGTYGPVVERDRPGPIVNTATADSDETEPVDDEHSVPIYVPVPSLAIDKDGPGVAEIGDTIVYTITVTNNGDVDLTNVTLTDPFLGLTEFIGPLAIGQSVTFNPTYGPVTEADLPGPITNVATADSDETQPVQDSHLIHIDTPPVIDLSLTIGVNNPTPSIGEDVVFTVTLTNADGFATATGVNVKSLLPAGYDFVSADPEIGLYNGPTNTWAVGVVPPGVSVTLQITATVTDIDDYEVLAEVSAAGQQDVDSTPANASVLSEDDDDKVPVEPGPAGGGGGLACIGKVIINEIAWSGTAADATNEWIELRNLGSEPVDLTGWTLQWRKKNPVTVEDFTWSRVDLSGTINGAGLSACEIALQDPEPSVEFEKRAVDDVSWYVVSKPLEDHGGYYTLERLSDRTIANVDADMIYDPTASPALQLHDEGDEVRLLDASGNIVSTANAFVGPGWPAGDAAIHATMERTDPLGEDTASNWHTNIGITTYGTDADGQPLVATAHVVNSQSLEEWTLFATLQATSTTPGTTVDVPLDLTQAERRESGWPWIRVTRPVADVAGGGAAVETSSYTFGGHSIDGEYLFEIDTTGWTPGEHLVWIVYGEGEAVLVPITVLP